MTNTALRLVAVSFSYDSELTLSQIDLEVEPGEVHCVLGPSGCGKSTLLRVVAGLERATTGRVEIDERVVSDSSCWVPAEKRPVGLVFQDLALFPHLTVAQNIAFGLKSRSRDERATRVEELLELVSLAGLQHHMPTTLSGGQQQRVAIARALAPAPSIMLLDEPFSGLDASLRPEVRDATLELLRGAGVATLIVTHDPLEAISIGDRLSVMHRGYVLQSGTPLDLYQAPTSRVVARSLGEVNTISCEARSGRVETPWGSIDAPAVEEAASADVLIRPEWLSVSTAAQAGTVPGELVSSLWQGGRTRLRLRLRTGAEVTAFTDSAARTATELHLGLSRHPVVVARCRL
ncbi:MAG: ABC transporter ATP-binding protein [Planctomycetota bacterium]